MGCERIAEAFARLRGRGEGALLVYLVAGDPSPERSLDFLRAAARGGADLLELGLPFSDPVADGPTIQAAGLRALKAGTTPETTLELAALLRQDTDIPILIMSYYNPILRMGEEIFCRRAAACGVDGLIVPDLPPEEAAPLAHAAEEEGLALTFLATPETGEERLRAIAQRTQGFLYLVGRYGTTGARGSLAPETIPLIRRVRALLPDGMPLAVGFGLSRPQHVRGVIAAGADGAVVGSSLVEKVAQGASPEGLSALVGELKGATRS
ncbi:MAG: Tryptophan synthase alpha chain [Acetothermia bacterium 64_32]|nr:MAG: Tryptophan synthase alpha chain [Acetothermia bacterium 64_32]HAF69748.1 tryptophan synthase subunit alpha [Candidatus Acetothermia bacterium]